MLKPRRRADRIDSDRVVRRGHGHRARDPDAHDEKQAAHAMRLIAKHGLVRPSELSAEGIHHETLARLESQGKITQPTRGLYQRPDWGDHESFELGLISKLVPRSVICLESALMFHGLTVQVPTEIWVAIGRNDRKPKFDYPFVRFVRFGPKSFDLGIEVHVIDGIPVNIYCAAKTVADCFRLRHLVGDHVAIEGLRKSIDTRQTTASIIHEFAVKIGIPSLMNPYVRTTITYDS